MLKCLFCGHEFQGNQYVAGRDFRQGKGCPTVTDEALVDIHYNNGYKLDGKILERMQRFEELHDEVGPSSGKRKKREEGARPTAAQKGRRQNTITESYASQWQMEFKKRWLRFVYSHRLAFNIFRSEPWLDIVRNFMELSGPMKVLWPSENEIADIKTVVRTADDVAADLAEVRAPFYVTGATIMSDGRKSRDARPIVNFLAGGSCGVMLIRTMNMEGERDRAPYVLARWIKVFDDFPPKCVNAICTDSASAYVVATNMVQRPEQRPEHRRITLDRGGLHMSRFVQWTQDVTREVAQEVRALPAASAHFIVQKVQARCTHMLKPALATAHLLCPSRRDLRYYEGVVSDYDASLVREAETYILLQTGFSVASPEYETACAQLCDFHTQRGGIAWGGRNRDKEANRCADDVETYEAGCWWSKWGQCASELQVIALRVMYIWTCSSRAERNWAVHEGVQTKKCNQLEFENVAKLVEISASVRLLSHQRAGRGFALPWTLDESLLDVERGIGTRPLWKGTDESRTQEELESQRQSGCGGGVPGQRPAHVRSGMASFAALPPSTKELRRGSSPDGRLSRLLKGPSQRLEDRLAGGTSPIQGDERDREGLTGVDGGVLAAGEGGAEVAAAVEVDELMNVRDEGRPAGGGGGFSKFGLFGDLGSLGIPPGESESRGNISADMQNVLGQISALHPECFSPAMHDELMSSAPMAEGNEDRTPPGETSAERLDRLDSRRGYLMARADPRTQELARLAAEERQRQPGTFTPASLHIETTAHMGSR
ncbi:hypothetical protein CBR_g8711 [Chara braunii]|uniref:DUF659 domain-containing protein n=1 Tax=Chara braunii TaxID=69332 RepID=A0A388KML4_CHABU|nr:hypothetical protein CBR_g8711 [Chara braunii]|eukprot:GBG71290.1 hypothetical protein CBR_g8711 [Chara braunii]